MRVALLSFLIGCFCFSSAQTILEPEWSKIRNNTNGDIEAWGLDLDDSENIYWPVSLDSTGQGLDILCYKYNEDGEEMWEEPFFFGGPGPQQSYVTNYALGALYIGGRDCPAFIQSCDMSLLKVDPANGSLIWDRSVGFSANGYEEIDGLVIEPDAIYAGGWAQELAPQLYFTDIGLWKLDPDGNTEWTNYLGDSATAEHQDGHFVVDDNYIYSAGLWGGTGLLNVYNGSSFLAKFDKTDGSLVDSVSYGFPPNGMLHLENTLGMASNGEFLYLVGYSTPVSVNNWQILLAKFDKDLNLIWQESWGGEHTESARGIAVVDDVIYIAGLTESPSITGSNSREALLLRYSTDGNYISHQIWGDEGFNAFRDIVVRPDGGKIYLSGTSITPDAGQAYAAFLLKIDNTIDATSDLYQDEDALFSVYPNPVKGQLNLHTKQALAKPANLTLYNLQGQEMWSTKLAAGTDSWQVESSLRGVFWLSMETPERSSVRKLIFE